MDRWMDGWMDGWMDSRMLLNSGRVSNGRKLSNSVDRSNATISVE